MRKTLVTHHGDALESLRSMPDNSVDLVFTSPPYEDARTYEHGNDGRKFKLRGQAWVDWLARIVVESARVSRGLVCVNMSSPVRQRSYSAAVEWLVADLTRVHSLVCGPAPYAWVKSAGIPGSGGPDYHRRDWEPIYTFAVPSKLPLSWSNNLAFGTPPKHLPGGDPSHRRVDGLRVGSRFHGKRTTNGSVRKKWYQPPDVANPGNVIRVNVGGSHLGNSIAHEGEAPMPEDVARRFVCWYCRPDGVVLDPFCGTGTTCAVAIEEGRRAVGIDIRRSQIRITQHRCLFVTPSLFENTEINEVVH